MEDWCGSHNPKFFQVIVAIHNRDNDLTPISDKLDNLGFNRVVSLVEFVNIFPDRQPFRYWLANNTLYNQAVGKIVEAISYMKDDLSVDNYLRILQFRMTGNSKLLKPPSFEDQYEPLDCPEWPEPMRLIDCGAFDGDTILSFARRFRLEAVAAFEPDPKNYANLVQNLKGMDSINIPCATGAENLLCKFETGLGEAGAVLSDGNAVIQCVKIDDILPSFRPTLIKMDVEGAELDTLLGAESLIRQFRPGLAISLYHKPTDLWEIPLLLQSWSLGYEFYLRCHRFNTFDSVLYAFQA